MTIHIIASQQNDHQRGSFEGLVATPPGGVPLPAEDIPAPGVQATQYHVNPAPGIHLGLIAWGNILFVAPAPWNSYSKRYDTTLTPWRQNERIQVTDASEGEVPPATIQVVSTLAEHQSLTQSRYNQATCRHETAAAIHTYQGRNVSIRTRNNGSWFGGSGGRSYEERVVDEVPYNYLTFEVTAPGVPSVQCRFPFEFPATGPCVFALIDDATAKVAFISRFYGREYPGPESLRYTSHNNPLETVRTNLRDGTLGHSPQEWWAAFLKFDARLLKGQDDDDRLAATLKHKTIAPTVAELAAKHPLEFAFLRWLKHGKTFDKLCNNTLLTSFLKATVPGGVEAVRAALWSAMTTSTEVNTSTSYDDDQPSWRQAMREFCLTLPGASDKAQEEEAKQDWTKRKGNGAQADGLGVTAAEYPLLRAAIEASNIPLSIFHQPDKQPVNREFGIWELALAQPGWADVIYEIAQDAGRRGTYEKDITPYLAFILWKLPAYLDRHAPATKGTPKAQVHWKCLPKYVQSTQAEIEANENGTVTTRSAFTPVADNENRVVTVPYVAVVVGGVRTQWCYAQQYHLFEQGFSDPISGGIVARDFEPKLNGRDDYGLCFYTLIGTHTATGYPTFLIIFERLTITPAFKEHGEKHLPACGTRVHFHRVRPQRSKDGVTTPACKLIEACYQYMAGNIPASQITAQQGDMIYIHYGALDAASPLDQKAKVGDPRISPTLGFESHRHISFSGADIELHPNQAKQPANRLGFMRVPVGGMAVRHPEHEDIEHLDEGWYEIRRCRSWEATPSGIWSLMID